MSGKRSRGMLPVSERRVCRVLGQHRSTQRKTPRGADDEAALTEDIIALARQYGRYGYRRVTAFTRRSSTHRAPGWFSGKCGSIAAYASSDNQNSERDIPKSLLLSGSSLNQGDRQLSRA